MSGNSLMIKLTIFYFEAYRTPIIFERILSSLYAHSFQLDLAVSIKLSSLYPLFNLKLRDRILYPRNTK